MIMSQSTLSILGCGWLGLPLAEQLLAEGYKLRGSATTPEKVAQLQHKGIDGYPVRLIPQPDGELTKLLQADTVIVDIPPRAGQFGDAFHPAQLQALALEFRSSTVRHIIHISSTSVYPELNRLVEEDDVQHPDQSAAPALVLAEQALQALASTCVVTTLRCGGLMGYDRIPGKYVAGRTVTTGDVPVNYIHRDDVIGIIRYFISHPQTGVFNVVAPEHPTRAEVYEQSCRLFGFEQPILIKPQTPSSFKQVSVSKLMEATGYAFRYANPMDFYYKREPV